jgi:hypothetical protein
MRSKPIIFSVRANHIICWGNVGRVVLGGVTGSRAPTSWWMWMSTSASR